MTANSAQSLAALERLAALAILVADEAPATINRYAYVRRELVEMIRKEMADLSIASSNIPSSKQPKT